MSLFSFLQGCPGKGYFRIIFAVLCYTCMPLLPLHIKCLSTKQNRGFLGISLHSRSWVFLAISKTCLIWNSYRTWVEITFFLFNWYHKVGLAKLILLVSKKKSNSSFKPIVISLGIYISGLQPYSCKIQKSFYFTSIYPNIFFHFDPNSFTPTELDFDFQVRAN